MDASAILITVITTLSVAGTAYVAFRPYLRLHRQVRQLEQVGIEEVGTVIEVAQTGLSLNDIPEMRVVLRVQPAGAAGRQVTVKQLLDLGSIPRVGDTVLLATDPDDPAKVLITGMPRTQPVVKAPVGPTRQLSEAQELDVMSLTPRLRDHGIRGIGTVLTMEAGEGDATRFTVEVDSVVEAKRVVTVTQVMYGDTYAAGDRAYLLIDPDDRNVVALFPLSFSWGVKPSPQYRLDKRVLGPQLLREGAKGQGTVLRAERQLAPVLASMGHVKLKLLVRIVPEDGSEAYEAEQEMTFSSEEKVQQWGSVGSVLPVRYDWHDRMTFCGDLMSLGYPDPYAEFEKADLARQSGYEKARLPPMTRAYEQ